MAMNELKTIEMMAVLTEPTRIKILQLISSEGQMCAKDILPMFQITQPTLSHHLTLLVESEILLARKDGRFTYYSVNKSAIESIRKLIDSLTEPPVVRTIKKTPVAVSKKTVAPVLKKKSSVPAPKIVITSPDLDEIKKSKKKKKSDKKKKDKDKDKKKKK